VYAAGCPQADANRNDPVSDDEPEQQRQFLYTVVLRIGCRIVAQAALPASG
jgi:hypothetical protein